MKLDRPASDTSFPGASASVPSARAVGLVYDVVVLAIAGSALFFIFAGSDAGLHAAGGLGAVASFALGYASLSRGVIALGPGVARYSRLWVAMTTVSALGFVSGKWQPVVLFAVAAVAMTLLYALGGWLGSRSRA